MPLYFSLFLYYVYSTLTIAGLFTMPKRKSPEDFLKKACENGSENNKDTVRGLYKRVT
jgi:hypothetical protein